MESRLQVFGICLLVAVVALLFLWQQLDPTVAWPILALLVAAVLIVGTRLVYRAWARKHTLTPPSADGPSGRLVLKDGADYRVTVDEDRITLTHLARGTTEAVAWRDLTGVFIVAVDDFPTGSISYVLHHGDRTIEVPLGANGNETLLAKLQDKLPGFDNEALIEAMAMLHGSKRVWPAETTAHASA